MGSYHPTLEPCGPELLSFFWVQLAAMLASWGLVLERGAALLPLSGPPQSNGWVVVLHLPLAARNMATVTLRKAGGLVPSVTAMVRAMAPLSQRKPSRPSISQQPMETPVDCLFSEQELVVLLLEYMLLLLLL